MASELIWAFDARGTRCVHNLHAGMIDASEPLMGTLATDASAPSCEVWLMSVGTGDCWKQRRAEGGYRSQGDPSVILAAHHSKSHQPS